ncbi:glutamyl-tRNA reductase [Galactobacter caseinivorans]|uniref:Glutamyl-tRNA reductase n=1 Tax=Galactobacter caseinivorans TaxID=2676123 RepID=A0A496PN64_9MICC|nr:glutamyl-tRNA reductase [Galactobacter caseinivorans]RKW71967.1 glutamyl-tRNA reductase [Galactobacter caseinivorans]
MVLMSLIASHAELDLETVARLSAAAGSLSPSSLAASPALQGTVVLSTCNRFEIYAEAGEHDGVDAARSALVDQVAGAAGMDRDQVSEALTTRSGADTVRHLFSVGAGLDSAVVGEREIAGQVRRALIEAQSAGTATGRLTKLFQSASRAAKEVQTSTTLGSRGKSIVSVALDLAEDVEPGAWAERTVVLFGTGAYAGATLKLLEERGARTIGVYSASGRAEEFVASRGGVALDGDDLALWLAQADVIIGCSGGSQRLEREDLTEVRTPGHPLIAIDLALSHDFDPALDELDGVSLLTLESVRMAAPTEQVDSVRRASQIVAQATEEFERDQRQRTADSAIVALRRHTQSVLESEVSKVRAQHGCTAAAEEVEFAMRRMIKQLLHVPTVRAREMAAEGRIEDYTDALESLFGIEVPVSPAHKARKAATTQPQRATAAELAQAAELAAKLSHAASGMDTVAAAPTCPAGRELQSPLERSA